jgi:hypothetical protein
MMKKSIFFAALIIGIMSASSLKAQFSIGPGFFYASSNAAGGIGLVANGNYDITEKFGAMADYTYYLTSGSKKWWSLDVDGTYVFFKKSVEWYALAGLDFLYYKAPSGNSYNYTGVNIGVGWKVTISDKIKLVPEWRYTFGTPNYLRLGAKLMFTI